MTTVELTDDNFETTIKDNDIVLVDFGPRGAALAISSPRSSSDPRRTIPTSSTESSTQKPRNESR